MEEVALKQYQKKQKEKGKLGCELYMAVDAITPIQERKNFSYSVQDTMWEEPRN